MRGQDWPGNRVMEARWRGFNAPALAPAVSACGAWVLGIARCWWGCDCPAPTPLLAFEKGSGVVTVHSAVAGSMIVVT